MPAHTTLTDTPDTPNHLLATSTDAELGARIREMVAERDRARFAYVAAQRAQEDAEETRRDAYEALHDAERAIVEALFTTALWPS